MYDPVKKAHAHKKYIQSGKGKAAIKRRSEKRHDTEWGKWTRAIRSRIQRALKNGTLIKTPCIACGSPKSEAHHRDYSKPLEVEWLCRKCHIMEHGGKPH